MKKFIALFTVTLFAAFGVFGQKVESETISTPVTVNDTSYVSSPENGKLKKNKPKRDSSDFKKFEVFVGYSISNSKFKEYKRDTKLQSIQGLNANEFNKRKFFKRGFEVSGVYNFSRYFGAKGSFSMNFNKRKGRINNQRFTVKERLTSYLAGVQFKDNSEDAGAFRPFAHALIGVTNAKSSIKNCSAFGTPCPPSLNKRRFGFTSAFGGGIDIKLGGGVTLRAIQVDYRIGKVSRGFNFASGIVF